MKLPIVRLLTCAMALGATAAFAAPYSATGAGTSTIGGSGTPDYATLKAACDDVITAGTRDATTWTFEIAGNTTEAAPVFLAADVTPGGKILFKPAVGVSPVISFTATRDVTVGTTFAIGVASGAVPTTKTGVNGTNGIEIDGSNTVSGTTRDLTFESASGINAGTGNDFAIISLIGDTDNITIKNCIVNNLSPVGNTASSAISARPVGPNLLLPDNWIIDNCTLRSNSQANAVGVNIAPLGGNPAAGNAVTGFTIRDCDITAQIRGILINYGYGYTLDGNRIVVGTAFASNGTDIWGVFNVTSNTPPANITTVSNNRIYARSGSAANNTNGPTGLGLSSMGTGATRILNVYNNEVVIVNAGARNADIAATTRGIWLGTSAITIGVYNNTVWIPDNSVTTNSLNAVSPNAFGIGGQSGAVHFIDIKGNIVAIEEANVPAISQSALPTGAGTYASDYNIVYASGGAKIARRVTTLYSTLADYLADGATGTNEDNSDEFDPKPAFTNTTVSPTATDLTLIPGTYPATEWAVPPIGVVTTDFEGDARDATNPYRGFDELVVAANQTPTDITVTPATVAENTATTTVIGALTTTDPDNPGASQTFTYALATGDGTNDADNSLVAISGTDLVVNGAIDFETNPTLEIFVQTTDSGSPAESFSKALVITVTNVVENAAPTDITLTPSDVDEDATVGTLIGALTSTDSDTPAQTFTYALVAGNGTNDADNGLVSISGSDLLVNGALDFSTNPTLEIRVQSTDSGESNLTFTKSLVVTVNDVPSGVSDWMILNEK